MFQKKKMDLTSSIIKEVVTCIRTLLGAAKQFHWQVIVVPILAEPVLLGALTLHLCSCLEWGSAGEMEMFHSGGARSLLVMRVDRRTNKLTDFGSLL